MSTATTKLYEYGIDHIHAASDCKKCDNLGHVAIQHKPWFTSFVDCTCVKRELVFAKCNADRAELKRRGNVTRFSSCGHIRPPMSRV